MGQIEQVSLVWIQIVSDGVNSVLGLCELLSTPSLSEPLLPGVVVPVRILSMGQIDLFNIICIQENPVYKKHFIQLKKCVKVNG